VGLQWGCEGEIELNDLACIQQQIFQSEYFFFLTSYDGPPTPRSRNLTDYDCRSYQFLSHGVSNCV
jgi:hypothetical protein